MVAHIGIIGEYRHEALQSGFVMFGFIIKNTDIVIIPGQAFQAFWDMFSTAARILIVGKLFA